jgi:hypothetical protein
VGRLAQRHVLRASGRCGAYDLFDTANALPEQPTYRGSEAHDWTVWAQLNEADFIESDYIVVLRIYATVAGVEYVSFISRLPIWGIAHHVIADSVRVVLSASGSSAVIGGATARFFANVRNGKPQPFRATEWNTNTGGAPADRYAVPPLGAQRVRRWVGPAAGPLVDTAPTVRNGGGTGIAMPVGGVPFPHWMYEVGGSLAAGEVQLLEWEGYR